MTGQPDQIVVARDDPYFIFFVPMDRVFIAQPAVIAIGIGDDVRSEHIVLKRAAHDPPSWRFSGRTAGRRRDGMSQPTAAFRLARVSRMAFTTPNHRGPAPARPKPGRADPAFRLRRHLLTRRTLYQRRSPFGDHD